MKKLIMLFHKYVCGRVDIKEGEASPIYPFIQYGDIIECYTILGQRVDDTEVIARYIRVLLPLYSFGFERDWSRKREVAGWRAPELYYCKYVDGDHDLILTIILTEEDTQRTLDEEVRRRNKLNDGLRYYHDNINIGCIGPHLIRGIATEHLSAGDVVCLDPDNPGHLRKAQPHSDFNHAAVAQEDLKKGQLVYWDKDKGTLCTAPLPDPVIQMGITRPLGEGAIYLDDPYPSKSVDMDTARRWYKEAFQSRLDRDDGKDRH